MSNSNNGKLAQYVTCVIKKFHRYDGDINYQKVKHYCHFTGKFKGAAHNICNLRCSKEIPL